MNESDEPRERTPIGRAIDEAQRVLAQGIEAEGGRVLCAVMIVHADGVTPNAGLDVESDPNDGPQSPDDIVALALHGVTALASRYGIEMGVFDAGAIGGQG